MTSSCGNAKLATMKHFNEFMAVIDGEEPTDTYVMTHHFDVIEKIGDIISTIFDSAFHGLHWIPRAESKGHEGQMMPVYDCEWMSKLIARCCPLLRIDYKEALDTPLCVLSYTYVQWCKLNLTGSFDRPSSEEIEIKRNERICWLFIDYLIKHGQLKEEEREEKFKAIL